MIRKRVNHMIQSRSTVSAEDRHRIVEEAVVAPDPIEHVKERLQETPTADGPTVTVSIDLPFADLASYEPTHVECTFDEREKRLIRMVRMGLMKATGSDVSSQVAIKRIINLIADDVEKNNPAETATGSTGLST